MYDLKESKQLLSSTEDRPIFEDLKGSKQGQGLDSPRPRPRTSKTVLEAKDALEAATSDQNTLQLGIHSFPAWLLAFRRVSVEIGRQVRLLYPWQGT